MSHISHTLLLSEGELVALSTAILSFPDHHAHGALESARVKVRDALDGRIQANYEDDYGLIHRHDDS